MRRKMIERVTLAMNVAAEQWALGTDNEAWECPYEILARASIEAMKPQHHAMLDWAPDHEPLQGGPTGHTSPVTS